MASAGPHASLHLAPDRLPRQHPTAQFFTGRMPFLPPNQQRQALKAASASNEYKSMCLFVDMISHQRSWWWLCCVLETCLCSLFQQTAKCNCVFFCQLNTCYCPFVCLPLGFYSQIPPPFANPVVPLCWWIRFWWNKFKMIWMTNHKPCGLLFRWAVSTHSLDYDVCVYHDNWPSVLWRCWLGGRKGIRPVKNCVVRCWHGYLSGTRCRLAYGSADATATHCLLLQ